MLYIKRSLLFIIAIHNFAFALPELKTKQALENLLFISDDAKVTYFQKNSGELNYSFNYKISTILKSPKHTRYRVEVAKNIKHIAIEVDKSFHKNKTNIKLNDIYIAEYLSTNGPKLVGNGTDPNFQLKGKYLTFFNPQEKEIHIYDTISEKVIRKLKIVNSLHPNFIPIIKMLTPDTIIYNDINDKGYEAILMYSLIEKKFTTIYKAQKPAFTLNYCFQGEKSYIVETPYDSVTGGSQILSIDMYNNPGFKNTTQIYSSEFSDIGSALCYKDSLYFIKTTSFSNKLNLRNTEVAKISKDSPEIQILTNDRFLTQVYEFSGMVLTNLNGKVLIVENNTQMKSDAIKKPEVRL